MNSRIKIKASIDGVPIYNGESDLDKIDNIFTTIKKKVK